MTEIDNIRRIARERAEYRKARMRESYALARELGFSSQEAQVLAGRSLARIRKLAEELSHEPV